MMVDPARAAGQHDYKGATYYFCAKSCEQRFAADPEKYLAPQAAPKLVTLGTPKSNAQLVTLGVKPNSPDHPSTKSPDAVIDPVCGMTVDPAQAAGRYEYKSTTYYFCNPRCEQKFKSAPETFLDRKSPDHQITKSPDGWYFCPMDPEV